MTYRMLVSLALFIITINPLEAQDVREKPENVYFNVSFIFFSEIQLYCTFPQPLVTAPRLAFAAVPRVRAPPRSAVPALRPANRRLMDCPNAQ